MEKPLLEPVDVQPVSQQPEKRGLLDNVREIFSSPQRSEPDSQQPLEDSSISEPHGQGPDQRILAAVPDVIGDGSSPAPTGAPGDAGQLDDPVAALMAQVAFEEQDVKDQLEELFEWLAERFDSEHWKLTERQSRMLGRPTAQVLNSVWAKLCTLLPDIIARWCESTPGATAFIAACGLVVLPKALKQVAISRERRETERHKVQRPQPVAAASHPFVPKVQPPEPIQ